MSDVSEMLLDEPDVLLGWLSIEFNNTSRPLLGRICAYINWEVQPDLGVLAGVIMDGLNTVFVSLNKSHPDYCYRASVLKLPDPYFC